MTAADWFVLAALSLVWLALARVKRPPEPPVDCPDFVEDL